MDTQKAQDKILDIGHERTCDCKSFHVNCLTAKEWLKNQIGVWEFYYEGRDIRDKDEHPAVYPLALSTRVIKLFSHQGELILDPFVGSGTSLVSARDTGRNAVGFDLNPDYIELSKQRLAQLPLLTPSQSETKQLAICDDAKNIPSYLKAETVACIVTSPPYANLLNRKRKNKSRRGDLRENDQYLRVEQYSQDPRDLGTMEIDEYADAMAEIFGGLLPLLKAKAHCVINVADIWWQDTRIPVHIYVIEALESVGYEFRNTIIWDRTNIVNRVGIFGWPSNYITMGTTFEYLLDFRRPE